MAPPPLGSPTAPAAQPATPEREQKDEETSRSQQQLGSPMQSKSQGLHPCTRGSAAGAAPSAAASAELRATYCRKTTRTNKRKCLTRGAASQKEGQRHCCVRGRGMERQRRGADGPPGSCAGRVERPLAGERAQGAKEDALGVSAREGDVLGRAGPSRHAAAGRGAGRFRPRRAPGPGVSRSGCASEARFFLSLRVGSQGVAGPLPDVAQLMQRRPQGVLGHLLPALALKRCLTRGAASQKERWGSRCGRWAGAGRLGRATARASKAVRGASAEGVQPPFGHSPALAAALSGPRQDAGRVCPSRAGMSHKCRVWAFGFMG